MKLTKEFNYYYNFFNEIDSKKYVSTYNKINELKVKQLISLIYFNKVSSNMYGRTVADKIFEKNFYFCGYL